MLKPSFLGFTPDHASSFDAFGDGGPRLGVFDCGGTIVDSQHGIVLHVRPSPAAARPRKQAVRRIIGLSLDEAVARLLPDTRSAAAGRRLSRGSVGATVPIRTCRPSSRRPPGSSLDASGYLLDRHRRNRRA
jgi:hypothetical protein